MPLVQPIQPRTALLGQLSYLANLLSRAVGRPALTQLDGIDREQIIRVAPPPFQDLLGGVDRDLIVEPQRAAQIDRAAGRAPNLGLRRNLTRAAWFGAACQQIHGGEFLAAEAHGPSRDGEAI